MKKFFIGVIAAMLVSLGVFALDSEYKNNLLKIDIKKTGSNNYKIDLFTQKPYNEPVKVIKKSDTNYYILLPETYHSITSVPSSGDVRTVNVKLYPYAGQDLNNGYTKINILTDKAVNFTAGVKTASAGTAPKIDTAKLAQLDSVFAQKNKENKVQTTAPASKTTTKPAVKSEPKTVVKTVAAPIKTAPPTKIVAKTQKPVQIAQVPKKAEVAKPVEKKAATTPKVKPQEAPVLIAKTQTKPSVEPKSASAKESQRIAQNTPSSAVSEVTNEVQDAERVDTLQEINEETTADEENMISSDNEAETIDIIPQTTEAQGIIQKIKTKLAYLHEFILDNLWAFTALLVVAVGLLIIAVSSMRRKKFKTAQQNPYVIEDEPIMASTDEILDAVAPQSAPAFTDTLNTQTAQPQYVGAGLHEAAAQSASADLQTAAAYSQAAQSQPYELYEVDSKPATQSVYIEPSIEEAASTQAVQESPEDEAKFISTVKITDKKGLCIVEFEGKTSLVGYVEDDIYVLHNFGAVKFDNPQIQFRVADKDENAVYYIVKVERYKFMIKSTSNSLALELVM